MSRCFPFPPPGYERKHRPEDLNLLKEAKHKEKKHKKEKKDKEKKREKEKDKDGGDEKHRDKKDRNEKHKDKKEKHRDKKKDKDKEDRGKDKDKSSISEESTVARKLEEESGGTIQPKGHSEDRRGLSNEGKYPAIFHGQNGGRPLQSSQSTQVVDDLKFVQELDRRIRDDENGRGSQLPQKVHVVDKRDQETLSRNSLGPLSEEQSDNKNKGMDRKTDPQGFGNEYSRNKLDLIATPALKNKAKGHLHVQNGRRMGEKERYKEAGDVKWRDKQKGRDNGTLEKDKEKKKEDTVKVKTENKKPELGELGKLKDDGQSNLGGIVGHTSADLLKGFDNNSYNEGKIRKREDMDTNGFLHESDVRPNKLQRPTLHPSTENGRKLEASQALNRPSPHDTHAVHDSVQWEKRDRPLNGIIEPHKPVSSKLNPSTTVRNQIAKAPKVPHDSNLNKPALKVPEVEDLIVEALKRPPHPDSKYLIDVLTIPKITDCFEDDDENWFSRTKSPSQRPPKEEAVDEDLHVWSEAVHIERADVCALPYVIPY